MSSVEQPLARVGPAPRGREDRSRQPVTGFRGMQLRCLSRPVGFESTPTPPSTLHAHVGNPLDNCACGPAPAADPPVDFAKDVLPILQKSCHECHGTKKQRGGL